MICYQYTLIKYVHNTASGESVNVGLALFAPERRYFNIRLNMRYGRISHFFLNAFDGEHYRHIAKALSARFERVSEKVREGDYDAVCALDLPIGFHRLMSEILPEDATTFQWGPIYGGVTNDPQQRFDALFSEFVTRHDKPTGRQLRQESQIWSDFEQRVKWHHLGDSLKPYTLNSALYHYEFHGSFLNGMTNVIEPISFDLQGGSSIVEKASHWLGRLTALKQDQEFAFHGILAAPSDESLRSSFDRARKLLAGQRDIVKHLIVESEDAGQFEELFNEIVAAKHQ